MTTARGVFLKNVSKNLLLVCFSTLAGIIAVEMVVSLLAPQQIRMATKPVHSFLRYDTDLGWANREGATVEDELSPDGSRYRVRINAIGLRGPEINIRKPAGTQRILFLGDSNTFGYGIQEEERFSNILTRRAPRGMEIINGGVFGYGTDQEAIFLERNLLRLSPDLVVLAVSAGDLSDVMSSVNAGTAKPFCRIIDGKFTLNNTPVPRSTPLLSSRALKSKIKVFLYRHSHLYRLLQGRVLALNRYMTDTVMEMDEREGFSVMVEIIRGMQRVCDESGADFRVLLISHGEWIEGMRRDSKAQIGYYVALKQTLAGSGVKVMDTAGAFVDWRGGELFFPSDAVHLSREGNRLLAVILAKYLQW